MRRKSKAKLHNVESLCFFEIGDIRINIEKLHGYNIVILGAIGPILGSLNDTLYRIRSCIASYGYLIIDDAYIPDNSNLYNSSYLKRTEVLSCFQKASFKIIDEDIPNQGDQIKENQNIYRSIQKRANELILLYLEKKRVFENYLQSQQRENDILGNKVTCVTWLLQKN